MPTRTYATDVYLMCPCSECEGREVRITLRKFRILSRLPSPACDQAVHQLVSGDANKTRWLTRKHPAVVLRGKAAQRLGPNAGGRLKRGGGAVGRLVAGTAFGVAGCVCGSWSRMRHQSAAAA
jgi:hypothetical protein